MRIIKAVAFATALLFASSILFIALPVGAHVDPPGCNASGLQQFPSVSPIGAVQHGDTLTYLVAYSNIDPDGAGPIQPCNIDGVNASITLPNGTVINTLVGASMPVGTSISCPGGAGCAAGPYSYNVAHVDETGSPPKVTTVFNIDGILHSSEGNDAASDQDSLSSDVEHPGNIIVVKQTNPDGATTTFEFDPSWGVNFFLSDGQQNDSGDLDPGVYSVAETVPAGWDLDSATCDDESPVGAINLGESETVTCTFTNEKDSRIIVVKETDPNGDPQIFDFTASYDGDGFSLSDGQSNDSGDLDPGIYSVAETLPAGWDLESVACSDDSAPAAINLAAGEVVTCTFTNEKDANIIVIKETTPDGATTTFEFNPSWGPNFFLSDGQQNDSGDLDPSTYDVSELTPAGWSQTGATCDDESPVGAISLQAGETVTCTFTNEQETGNIIVVKQTLPDGDPQVFDFTASYDGDGFSLSDGQSNDSGPLAPGVYSVAETVPAGWDLDSATCDDESPVGAINLAADETVTCTFTNEKDSKIIVVKQTTPDGATTTFEFDPSWGVNFFLSDGQQNDSGDLDPGVYSVAETVPAGWNLDSATCSDGSAVGVINLAAGEVVTCTFNNSRIVVALEGCTPGYWKQSQHFDSWTAPYDPTDTFSSVFGRVITIMWSAKGKPGPVINPTLLQTLEANGGGINALARHAVAALLNSASGGVDYEFTTAEVISMFQTAFDSGNYGPTHEDFATANERGCPLN